MSFYPPHLRGVVVSTLDDLGWGGEAAVNLLMGTAAQESHLGKYLRQIRGPALGIYQMEPATHKDIWERWILSRREMVDWLAILGIHPDAERMVWDLRYATVMARLFYRRIPSPLPPADDVRALGEYWKRYWNTHLGAGTVGQFEHNYNRYVEA